RSSPVTDVVRSFEDGDVVGSLEVGDVILLSDLSLKPATRNVLRIIVPVTVFYPALIQ
ncbi:unnamed protein product, partial [Rotaria sordida]